MKTILKTAAFALSFATLSSCGNSNSKTTAEADTHATADSTHHSGDHIYACPMHPDVTGKEGDKCSKCGMKLEHNDDAGKDNGLTYFMQYASVPSVIEAGKEGTIIITPKIKGKESESVPLDLVHEKKIHLITVSKDLAYFDHAHPEYQSDGSYQLKVLGKNQKYANGAGHNEIQLSRGGDYFLFADYFPTGGKPQLEKMPVTVAGAPYKSVTYTEENLTWKGDGYTVSLEAEGAKWATNQPMHIKAVVSKDKKVLDANTLENYLGAKAHMVVLKTESFEYLHVHPEVENGNLDLHTTFEKPGVYRGWIQFQVEGKVRTADFVIRVVEGAKDEGKDHSHHH